MFGTWKLSLRIYFSICDFQKICYQKDVAVNLCETFLLKQNAHSHAACVWRGRVVVQEFCGHACVPVSPPLLHFELIIQVQAIYQEGIDKYPENIDFLQMSSKQVARQRLEILQMPTLLRGVLHCWLDICEPMQVCLHRP